MGSGKSFFLGWHMPRGYMKMGLDQQVGSDQDIESCQEVGSFLQGNH